MVRVSQEDPHSVPAHSRQLRDAGSWQGEALAVGECEGKAPTSSRALCPVGQVTLPGMYFAHTQVWTLKAGRLCVELIL